ncbi:MAG: hypothetical protein KatS3mg091_613 [Patescibacteria group bacterium]|nr:MAG: hypothetical protein KatS3mg091_613 [Patescibacteria group bacterium]
MAEQSFHKRRVVGSNPSPSTLMKKNKPVSEKAEGYWGAVVIILVLIRFYLKPSLFYSEFYIKPLLFLPTAYFFFNNVFHHNFWELLKIKNTTFFQKTKLLALYLIIFLGFYLLFSDHKQTLSTISLNLATSLTEQIFMISLIFLPKIKTTHNLSLALVKTAVLYLFLRLPSLYLNTEFFGTVFVYTLISSFFLFLSTTLVFYKTKNIHYAIALHFVYLNLITLFYL